MLDFQVSYSFDWRRHPTKEHAVEYLHDDANKPPSRVELLQGTLGLFQRDVCLMPSIRPADSG